MSNLFLTIGIREFKYRGQNYLTLLHALAARAKDPKDDWTSISYEGYIISNKQIDAVLQGVIEMLDAADIPSDDFRARCKQIFKM